MVFNKLFKRTMALALTTVLTTGMFAASDLKQSVAKAEDTATTTTTLFKESKENEKVLFNKLGVFYNSLSLDCFDKETGYLNDGYAIIPDNAKGMTIIETGYDLTMYGQSADGIVDIQSTECEKNDAAFMINVLSVDANGKVKLLRSGIDFETNAVKDGEHKLKFTLNGKGNADDKYEFTVQLYEDVERSVFNNTSQAKYLISKLFERKKAVAFSLKSDGEYVDAKTFLNDSANKDIMKDADTYYLYYKTIADYMTEGTTTSSSTSNIKKACFMIGKYKIQNRDIVWNVNWDSTYKGNLDVTDTKALKAAYNAIPKFEYTGKAQAPKVTKIALSKSLGLVNAADIPGSRLTYNYTQYLDKDKALTVKECKDKGFYVAAAMLNDKNDYKNYSIPYAMEKNIVKNGVIPFVITDVKPSIASAKVTVRKATYNKANQKAVVTKVTVGKTTLKAGTDYKVASVVKKNAGSYTVKITGIGNYKGTKNVKFTIAKKSLAKCTVVRGARMTLDGDTVLKRGRDYKEVKDNKKMYLVGMGNYTGKIALKITAKTKKK